MPGKINKLVPPSAPKPSVSAASSQPVDQSSQASQARPAYVPRFGRPKILVPDDFWSNLKQFLTERPIKIRERKDAPFTQTSFGGGFFGNLAESFRSTPGGNRPVNSRLAVAWGAGYGSFGTRLKEFFSPPKQPPLPPGIKAVKVKDIWSKDEHFGSSQVLAMLAHAAVIALLVVPIGFRVVQSTQAKNKVDVTPLDISPYMAKLPAGANKAGGGGGANDHTTTPVNRGKVPKFKWTQFTPPQIKIQNPNAKLQMDPSLLGPPDLKVANINAPTFGDPLANAISDSLGHGNGTGIGSGSGGGLGPGSGGGTGGGEFRAGVNGVGQPACIYCPNPDYSEEARKAKYQGSVFLDITISADGRVTAERVLRGPGMGLEEKAIAAVKTWKLRPCSGRDGKAVACTAPVEVVFRLL
ncbi:MAG TPA: energy transducer TonB [Candidatus Acidoferrum sp.]|nr:energy transducer TonB [Candidatus Acidoferrum sp.]